MAILPTTTSSKALPAPTEAKPEAKVEAAAETPQIDSVPKTESKADGISGFSRPLSPYPSVMSLLLLHKFLIFHMLLYMLVLEVVDFFFSSYCLCLGKMLTFISFLSLWLQYPDLKPPTSPTPSQP